jgi:predicted HTH domain antitoxin
MISIPEEINMHAFDLSLYLAAKMYEDGLVTAGQASEMVGITKRTFIELMGKYGVSVFSKESDEWYKYSMLNFNRAYADDEPEYTSDMVKEFNPDYNL